MQLDDFSFYNRGSVKHRRWILILAFAARVSAADPPYFATYTHHMEEPGALEVAIENVAGRPQAGERFLGSLLELEYGVKGWWTTEVYFSGQSTRNDSTLFTGYRWENRFRPLMGEHWINPVLYVEFANLSGADKTMKEVVGFDSQFDQNTRNAEARVEKKREIETKLILSSNFKGWNLSENVIAEKNLSNQPWEFGYAVGLSRPLALKASPRACQVCVENFRAGVEFYGGLGTRHQFGLRDTSHYVAPTVSLELPSGTTFQISPGFGMTSASHGFLLRFAVAYELPGLGRYLQRLWR